LLALFLGIFGAGYFYLVLNFYLVSLGCTPQMAIYISAFSRITYAASSAVWAYIPSIDRRVVIFAGISGTVLAFVLCGSQSISAVALGAGLEGAGVATIVGTAYSVGVYSHLLSHSIETLKAPQDDLLSDKLASNPYPGYVAAVTALGMICGPFFSGHLVNEIGREACFCVLSGCFAIGAALYLYLTDTSRSLFRLKEVDSEITEIGYHLVPSSPKH
jgi:hypothetical protein